MCAEDEIVTLSVYLPDEGNGLRVRCSGSKPLSRCQRVLVEDIYGG